MCENIGNVYVEKISLGKNMLSRVLRMNRSFLMDKVTYQECPNDHPICLIGFENRRPLPLLHLTSWNIRLERGKQRCKDSVSEMIEQLVDLINQEESR